MIYAIMEHYQAHPTVEYIINIRIGTEYFISVSKKLTSFESIDQYTASWKWHFDLTDSFKSHQNYTFNVSLIVKYGSHLYLIKSNEFWCITLEMFYEKVHANKNWIGHTEASQERNQILKSSSNIAFLFNWEIIDKIILSLQWIIFSSNKQPPVRFYENMLKHLSLFSMWGFIVKNYLMYSDISFTWTWSFNILFCR